MFPNQSLRDSSRQLLQAQRLISPKRVDSENKILSELLPPPGKNKISFFAQVPAQHAPLPRVMPRCAVLFGRGQRVRTQLRQQNASRCVVVYVLPHVPT